MSTITSEQVLLWAMEIKAQKSQTAMLEDLKAGKDFDSISKNKTNNYVI